MMKTSESGIVAELKRAIAESGRTRLALAKAAGLPYAVVHMFVAGKRGLSLDSAAALCDVLGLELRRVRRKRKDG
ncbi:MAG: helix-turn-helix transcriptional regulator [Phycisphaerales bacterium]|nr:helix-turn-helix transcriptional regulator [Phycisphaerales bacterium]